MPSLPGRNRRYPAPDPTATYVALAGYIGPHGPFPGGTRLRGDDPAVAATPEYWVKEPVLEYELNAIYAERFGQPRAA